MNAFLSPTPWCLFAVDYSYGNTAALQLAALMAQAGIGYLYQSGVNYEYIFVSVSLLQNPVSFVI